MPNEPSYTGKHRNVKPSIVFRPDGSELGIETLRFLPGYEDFRFTWGYEGFGPRMLARAILLDHTGDMALAERNERDFMLDVTSQMSRYRDWMVPVSRVARWVASRHAV